MRAIAAALQDQRRDARDWLIDARLGLGQHREVLAELLEIVTEDPLRERSWAQLMLARYRSGLKREALDAYSRARHALVTELGVDPGPELLDLHRLVLADDPSLAGQAPTVVSAAAGPVPSWRPVRQLPADPADFTGRRAQTEALASRLASAGMPVTVLWGPPGSGTTTLAFHAAHLASDIFPDGQLYACLGGVAARRDPQDVLAEMLRALGIPPSHVPDPGREREAMYRDMLAGRKVVLVADDAVSPAQVRPLLPGTAGSAVLVTSRFRLSGLAGAHLVEVGDMSPEEAVALLAAIVMPGHPGADAPDGQAGEAAEGSKAGEAGDRGRQAGPHILRPGQLGVADDAQRAVEAIWALESAGIIAGLAEMVRDIDLAEDLAQDALVAALRQWPEAGIPPNPGAWLMATAKHQAIDRLRRDERLQRIAAACGYLPLALRIAGTRLVAEPGLTAEDLARALTSDDRRLDDLAVDDLSVRAALDPAYNSLGAHNRRAFRLASLHHGGDMPGWLIPALTAGAGPAGDADAIAESGLLTAIDGHGRAARRYRLHPVSRTYSADRLAVKEAPATAAAAAARLAECWLELADCAAARLPRHPCVPAVTPWTGGPVLDPADCAAITTEPPGVDVTQRVLAWFTAEQSSLIAVTARACARGDYQLATDLALRQFTAYWQLNAYHQAREQWEGVAAAARRAGDSLAAARARYRLAVLTVCHGNYNEPGQSVRRVSLAVTQRDLVKCALEFQVAGDATALADAYYLLARCAMLNPDYEVARNYAEQGLVVADRAGDCRVRMLHLSALGTAQCALGAASQGLNHCAEAVNLAHQLGERAYGQIARRARDEAVHLVDQPPPVWSGWHIRPR